jgi:hypothetical protein
MPSGRSLNRTTHIVPSKPDLPTLRNDKKHVANGDLLGPVNTISQGWQCSFLYSTGNDLENLPASITCQPSFDSGSGALVWFHELFALISIELNLFDMIYGIRLPSYPWHCKYLASHGKKQRRPTTYPSVWCSGTRMWKLLVSLRKFISTSLWTLYSFLVPVQSQSGGAQHGSIIRHPAGAL